MTPADAALPEPPEPPELTALRSAWRRRERVVLLTTAFDGAAGVVPIWRAWRADPDRCAHLHVIVVDPALPSRARLALDASASRGSRAEPRDTERADRPPIDRRRTDALLSSLSNAWPTLTPNLHRLSIDDEDAFVLTLAPGSLVRWLGELVAQVDIFLLQGAGLPMFHDEPRRIKALGRLAAAGAVAILDSSDRGIARALASTGFVRDPEARPDRPASGGRVATRWRFAPTFAVHRPRLLRAAGGFVARRATVLGAGLAGCAAAWALAEQGWHVTVLDRHDGLAREASGNPVGLFHGIVNAHDGLHARFNRAAALEVERAVRIALDRHAVEGAICGLIRVASMPADTADGVTALTRMRALLDALRLPADYLQACSADEASQRSGLVLQRTAWFYPGGGWVDPAGLARSFIARGSDRIEVRQGVEVARLHRTLEGWRLLTADGALVAETPCLVLANGTDALRLIGAPDWPIESVRGQLSAMCVSAWPSATLPLLPVTGSGYVLPPIGGRVYFGATSQAGDADASVRLPDHLENLARLRALIRFEGVVDATRLQGRTAWRSVASDKMPVVGAVPERAAGKIADASSDEDRHPRRQDQPRFVARKPGLFLCTAFGSRGITWSALAGRILAAIVTGSPSPVEAALLDAVDPARFVSRRVRRNAGTASAD